MSELVNELRALCVDECRNRIDYRCVVCRGADAVERLAEAEDREDDLLALCEEINHALWLDPDASHDTSEAPHEIDERRRKLASLTSRLAAAEARDLVAELRDRHIPWSRETFGDGMRTVGICKHIEKELNEIRENPYSVEEWIDVAILALDGAWRTSVHAESVVEVLFEKLSKIRTRTYPKPVSDDEPSEHIRERRAR